MTSLDQNCGVSQGRYVHNSLSTHRRLYHHHKHDADALHDTKTKTMDEGKGKLSMCLIN
jgi:hypothetical protein